jgi:thioesterase domain-containing protein
VFVTGNSAAASISCIQLGQYLHEHIPLSAAMQVSVAEASQEAVVLSAPLAPNINHRETVFGGSASALAILAAWSLLHIRLLAEGVTGRLVIQNGRMDYLAPMANAFSARAAAPESAEWERFRRMLKQRGKGRVAVAVELYCAGRATARFHGDFVAIDEHSNRASAPARDHA